MRKNGQIVVGQVDLKHGDVLEMHVPLGFQPFNLSLVSPKVQICLDASIPGPTSAFKMIMLLKSLPITHGRMSCAMGMEGHGVLSLMV